MPQPQLLPFADEGSTNVLSHLLGFACGTIAGALVTTQRGARVLRATPAWTAVGIALLPLAAWVVALRP
jgi:hypothetical protein